MLDRLEEDRALDQVEGEERRRLKIKHEQILRTEEVKWRQKAKFYWFKEVNGNTKFFHRMANARRLKSQVNKISWNKNTINDPEEIENAFTQHFTSIYTLILQTHVEKWKGWIGRLSRVLRLK